MNKMCILRAILENKYMTVNELTHNLSLSHGKVSRMIEPLGFHKMCAHWGPMRTTRQREWQMAFHFCNSMLITAKTFWNALSAMMKT